MDRLTRRRKLAAFLLDHAGEWISRNRIAQVAGEGGYRQRLSELRAEGFRIECDRIWAPKLKVMLTAYRYTRPTRSKAA
jgi:hypothetical protein